MELVKIHHPKTSEEAEKVLRELAEAGRIELPEDALLEFDRRTLIVRFATDAIWSGGADAGTDVLEELTLEYQKQADALMQSLCRYLSYGHAAKFVGGEKRAKEIMRGSDGAGD